MRSAAATEIDRLVKTVFVEDAEISKQTGTAHGGFLNASPRCATVAC